MRYIVSVGILLATVGWLVLSYFPAIAAALPAVAFGSQAAQLALPWLAGITLLAFVVIQLDLVRATVRWFQPGVEQATAQAVRDFNLPRGAEIFWTMLPLVGTLMLAVWLLGIWLIGG